MKYYLYPDPRISLRERLVMKVRMGRLSPDKAEKIAKRIGLGMLTETACLDPVLEPTWTISMTLAWIRWRDPRWVCKTWLKWSNNHYRWVQDNDKRWDLVPEVALSAGDLFYDPEINSTEFDGKLPRKSPMLAGWNKLVAACIGGQVRAYSENGAGESIEVPPGKWLDGFPDQVSDGLVIRSNGEEVDLQNIAIFRSDVLLVWPENEAPPAPLVNSSGPEKTFSQNYDHRISSPKDLVVKALHISKGKLLQAPNVRERNEKILLAVQDIAGGRVTSLSESTIRRAQREYLALNASDRN